MERERNIEYKVRELQAFGKYGHGHGHGQRHRRGCVVEKNSIQMGCYILKLFGPHMKSHKQDKILK